MILSAWYLIFILGLFNTELFAGNEIIVSQVSVKQTFIDKNAVSENSNFIIYLKQARVGSNSSLRYY
jgi:hypothetical protein